MLGRKVMYEGKEYYVAAVHLNTNDDEEDVHLSNQNGVSELFTYVWSYEIKSGVVIHSPIVSSHESYESMWAFSGKIRPIIENVE